MWAPLFLKKKIVFSTSRKKVKKVSLPFFFLSWTSLPIIPLFPHHVIKALPLSLFSSARRKKKRELLFKKRMTFSTANNNRGGGGGGMMVTSKQSKTSTVTITGAFFHFCFFLCSFARAVHAITRGENSLVGGGGGGCGPENPRYRIDLFYPDERCVSFSLSRA